MIRSMIVDDEPLARRALIRMLQAHSDVSVLGEYSDGESALLDVQRTRPDLVFLDIRMPGLDGLHVAAQSFHSFSGVIIFVTAHDEHALEAFNLKALDYLLKPFTAARLAQALTRVRERVAQPMSAEALKRVLSELREREARPRYLERIPANRNGRIRLLPVASIERIDAMGNYASIRAEGGHYDVRETLQSLEKKLDPGCFIRVHRSTIVNMDHVREVQMWFGGGHQIVMKNGTHVRLSRYQTAAVEKLTGRSRCKA